VQLTSLWMESGCAFHCSRTWKGDRALERWLKGQKNAPGLCPICDYQRPPARQQEA